MLEGEVTVEVTVDGVEGKDLKQVDCLNDFNLYNVLVMFISLC